MCGQLQINSPKIIPIFNANLAMYEIISFNGYIFEDFLNANTGNKASNRAFFSFSFYSHCTHTMYAVTYNSPVLELD